MKKIVRLTEDELKLIMHKSVARALHEHNVDVNREFKIAQKELYQIGKNLSSIGLRLDGTQFYSLYKQMADAMIALNDALIQEIRKER